MKKLLIIIGLFLVICFSLIFYTQGDKYLIWQGDEAYHINAAKNDNNVTFIYSFWNANEINHYDTLYPNIYNKYLSVFTVSSSLLIIRFSSIFLAILFLIFIYLLARALFNKEIALYSTLFLSLNSLFVINSIVLTFQLLQGLLLILFFMFVYLLLKMKMKIFFITALLGLFIFMIFSLNGMILTSKWYEMTFSRDIPVLSSYLHNNSILQIIYYKLYQIWRAFYSLGLLLNPLVLFLFVYGLTRIKGLFKFLSWFMIGFVMLFLLMQGGIFWNDRYLLPIIMVGSVVAGYGLDKLRRVIPKKSINAVLIIIILFSLSTLIYSAYKLKDNSFTEKQDEMEYLSYYFQDKQDKVIMTKMVADFSYYLNNPMVNDPISQVINYKENYIKYKMRAEEEVKRYNIKYIITDLEPNLYYGLKLKMVYKTKSFKVYKVDVI